MSFKGKKKRRHSFSHIPNDSNFNASLNMGSAKTRETRSKERDKRVRQIDRSQFIKRNAFARRMVNGLANGRKRSNGILEVKKLSVNNKQLELRAVLQETNRQRRNSETDGMYLKRSDRRLKNLVSSVDGLSKWGPPQPHIMKHHESYAAFLSKNRGDTDIEAGPDLRLHPINPDAVHFKKRFTNNKEAIDRFKELKDSGEPVLLIMGESHDSTIVKKTHLSLGWASVDQTEKNKINQMLKELEIDVYGNENRRRLILEIINMMRPALVGGAADIAHLKSLRASNDSKDKVEAQQKLVRMSDLLMSNTTGGLADNPTLITFDQSRDIVEWILKQGPAGVSQLKTVGMVEGVIVQDGLKPVEWGEDKQYQAAFKKHADPWAEPTDNPLEDDPYVLMMAQRNMDMVQNIEDAMIKYRNAQTMALFVGDSHLHNNGLNKKTQITEDAGLTITKLIGGDQMGSGGEVDYQFPDQGKRTIIVLPKELDAESADTLDSILNPKPKKISDSNVGLDSLDDEDGLDGLDGLDDDDFEI